LWQYAPIELRKLAPDQPSTARRGSDDLSGGVVVMRFVDALPPCVAHVRA
jgi:hypothetical protein